MTTNQSYGSHYTKPLNKQQMASSTLDFLRQSDPQNFIQQQ